MSNYINAYDYSSKDSINQSSTKQNNYYIEDKNLSNNSKARSEGLSIKNKNNSNSKTKYKVTYSNSILNTNMNITNISQNLENKNVLNLNNHKTNNSIGNIKEINYYSNKKISKKRNNNNITSHNFYNKKINEILNSESNVNKTTNNYSNKKNNIKNYNTENNMNNNNPNCDLNNKTLTTVQNKNNNKIISNLINNKSKIKNIKKLKKDFSKKKGQKIIYAEFKKKRPSLPICSKYQNFRNIDQKKSRQKDEKENKSKNKNNKGNNKPTTIQNGQNKNKSKNNFFNNVICSNYYTNNVNSNAKNNNVKINEQKNNLIPMSLEYKILNNKKKKTNLEKEIKKCQSQSFIKYKTKIDSNTSNSKKIIFKKKSKHDRSYEGIIKNKKNMLKNNIIKSSSHSKTKKNPVVCINYKTKNTNKNKNSNHNFNYFMNNIPDEYNKNPLFLEIKNLWNKLKVTYAYQEMFITLTKQLEDKMPVFSNEINNLTMIYNCLNKLNEDIKKRNNIIDKIKYYSYVNFNENENNIEEMKNLLISLRMISIDVINDYSLFCKEISFDVLRNKINIDNIKLFNKSYINTMKTDTIFLFKNNYLNKIFYFSNKSDPFLIFPSLKIPQSITDNNKYIQLPIDEETMEKIKKCKYFILTEKISEYTMCNNKENINFLLSDKDNIVYDMINGDKNDTTINCTISNNKSNNSPLTTPLINKNQNSISNNSYNINENKTSINSNDLSKFCYINNINNDNNTKSNEEKKNNNCETVSNNNNTCKDNIIDEKDNIDDDKESNTNESIIHNSSPANSNEKMNKNEKIQNSTKKVEKKNENNLVATPYSPSKDTDLSSLYSSYLSSVPENIQQSFDIHKDIFYYSNLGIYPKIILFKDYKDLTIKGICTISFSQNINSIMSLNKKILVITSISCSTGVKISEILINLIDFCEKEEIFYDSIEVNLYYMKKEEGNFVLDEGLEKEIKSEAKFKWVRLENDEKKRKIKYHYIPNNIVTNKENSILNNLNINHLDNCSRCAILLNNYLLIKYAQENGINDISMLEHSKLYFILYLLNNYFLLNESNDDFKKDKENILSNLKGLKLKKIVRILSEYNNAILTNISEFRNDYLSNDNYNIDLLNYFVDIIEKNENKNDSNNLDNNICLNFCNICTNFSNIIKVEIEEYEYNIISMNDFIIEVFNIDNNDKEVIYFTKSEIENLSFIFYEQTENKSNIDEEYIKILFNKILKKILLKDSEEPIKSYKKLAVPSFSYQKKISDKNNGEEDKLKIIDFQMLDCNESFDFCIENIPNNNTKFSFPLDKNIIENNQIKVIKNNFVVAVLNPDLILDYHLPSLNIYYIEKEYWIKVKK